jgi:hypothetical protein
MALLTVSKAADFTVPDKTIGPETIPVQSLTDCLAAISERYFTIGHTLVFSWNKPATLTHTRNFETWENVETELLIRLHQAYRWPIVVSYTIGEEKHRPIEWRDKHSSYVLVVRFQDDEGRVIRDVREQTQKLQSLSAWNPRARFVVVLTGRSIDNNQQELTKAILKHLSDIQVVNAIILLKQSKNFPKTHSTHLSDLHKLMWFPFSPPLGYCGALNRANTIDTWISDKQQFFLNKDLFENKIPPNLGLCPLKISTSHFPSFVIFPDKNTTTLADMDGVDMAMLQHISELANVSIVLPPRADNITDSKLVDGKWTGPIGNILYNTSDLALGAWCFTLDDSLVVEGTDSYFTEEFTFFIPLAGTYPRYLSMTRVFAPDVWVLIFVLMFLAAITFRLLAVGQTTVECDTFKDISNCLLSAWSVVLGVGVHKMPLSQPLRWLFFLWLTYSLAINTVFQTYVTTYIVDPGYRHQIDSVDEIMESGLEVYVTDFLYELLGDNLLQRQKSWRKCGNANECLTTASASPGVVMLAGKVFAEYKSKELKCAFNYHESSSDLLHIHTVMVLKKGSPYLEIINSVIRRLVEGGYPGKFFKNFIQEKSLKCLTEIDQYVPMSLDQLQSAFVVMLVGLSLSLLLFFGELMVKMTRRNNRTGPKSI